MKITSTSELNTALLASTANRDGSTGSFQSALEAAKQAAAQSDTSITRIKSLEKKENTAPATTAHKTAGQELSEYLRKSPMQHMREAILKELGLTEESLAALPPEQQAAIEKTITDKIKEMLQNQSGNTKNQAQSALPGNSLLSNSLPSKMIESKA